MPRWAALGAGGGGGGRGRRRKRKVSRSHWCWDEKCFPRGSSSLEGRVKLSSGEVESVFETLPQGVVSRSLIDLLNVFILDAREHGISFFRGRERDFSWSSFFHRFGEMAKSRRKEVVEEFVSREYSGCRTLSVRGWFVNLSGRENVE